jgi:hypothetical protein
VDLSHDVGALFHVLRTAVGGEGVRAGERERVCGLIVASMSSLSLSP